jgi:multimeric flavodoxin WrbA
MKILALIGSPRKKGNTQVLVNEVVRGASSVGASCQVINVCDLAIAPCQGCESCSTTGVCVQKDDMLDMYPRILASDVLVIGSPVYWWGPSAQIKTFMDRMFALVQQGGWKKLRGKKAGIVTPYGDTDPDTPEHLIGMFRQAFDHLGMDIIGTLGVSAGRKGEVAHNKEAMEEAFNLGVRLCFIEEMRKVRK